MANKLQEILNKEGITQAELAKASGVAAGTINRFVGSKSIPSVKTKNVLIKALNTLLSKNFGEKHYEILDIFPEGDVSEKQIFVSFYEAKDSEELISARKIKRDFEWGQLSQAKAKESEELTSWGQLSQTLSFMDNFDDFKIIIDRGDTPDEKVADLLADFSILYRMLGGSGIIFELTDVLTLKNAFCYE